LKRSGMLNILAAACEALAAIAFFCALALTLILWQPARPAWGFLIHVLTLALFLMAFLANVFYGKKMRLPFSAPEIILFLIFIHACANAALSRTPFRVLEILPFILSGFFLFYASGGILAKRHEAMIPLFYLFLAAFIFLTWRGGHKDIWMPQGRRTAFYRGEKMASAALAEKPLQGCGLGSLPLYAFKYLPMPDRNPPAFRSSYGVILAEFGFIGAFLWCLFFAVLFYAVVNGLGNMPSPASKAWYVFFWSGAFLLFLIFMSGFFSPILSTPAGLYMILPLCGILWGMTRGDGGDARQPASHKSHSRRARKIFVIIAAMLILTLLVFQAIPFIASSLIHFRTTNELESPAFGRRANLAARLFPCHPEVHLAYAKHLRALPSLQKSSSAYVKAAYLRAIHWNPHAESIYMEYGHFLDLIKEQKSLASLLEAGKSNCPGSVEIRLFLFRAYMNLGKRKAALDELDALSSFYPVDYAVQFRIGKYYAEAGANSASQEAYALAEQMRAYTIGGKTAGKDTKAAGKK